MTTGVAVSMVPNGGKKININSTDYKVINSYKPSWVKEYGEEFVTWDGRTIRALKGSRFTLSCGLYGLTQTEIVALKNKLMTESITLTCDEFTGAVMCTSCSPVCQSANFYGAYYSINIELSATALDTSQCSGLA